MSSCSYVADITMIAIMRSSTKFHFAQPWVFQEFLHERQWVFIQSWRLQSKIVRCVWRIRQTSRWGFWNEKRRLKSIERFELSDYNRDMKRNIMSGLWMSLLQLIDTMICQGEAILYFSKLWFTVQYYEVSLVKHANMGYITWMGIWG